MSGCGLLYTTGDLLERPPAPANLGSVRLTGGVAAKAAPPDPNFNLAGFPCSVFWGPPRRPRKVPPFYWR
eukprot:4197718-Pyramimonas_sp.AAC.2